MYVVQPDQAVVVQQEGGRVQDQLRRGAGQSVQALAGEVQSVRVSAGALDHGGLLSGHLANLQQQQSIPVFSTLIGPAPTRLGPHWSGASERCLRQKSHAIKNQLGHPKPHTRC